jgi:hypothetical protein
MVLACPPLIERLRRCRTRLRYSGCAQFRAQERCG